MDGTAIDPELLARLASTEEPVEATITLDSGPGRGFIPADEVVRQVKAILSEVGREVGETYKDVNIFENLGSFAVRAYPAFLKALLRRPEVRAAMANQQSEDMLIRPFRKGSKPKGESG